MLRKVNSLMTLNRLSFTDKRLRPAVAEAASRRQVQSFLTSLSVPFLRISGAHPHSDTASEEEGGEGKISNRVDYGS